MQTYAIILGLLTLLSVVKSMIDGDEGEAQLHLISILVVLPLYGRVMNWW